MTQYTYIDLDGNQLAEGPDYSGWETDYPARVNEDVFGQPANGQSWDFINLVWFYSKAALKDYSKNKRLSFAGPSITSHGITLFTDDNSVSIIADIAQHARLQDPTALRGFAGKTFFNSDILDMADTIVNYRQNSLDAEAVANAAIDLGSITTLAQIDSSFSSSISSPVSRAGLSDAYDLINGKVDKTVTINGHALSSNVSLGTSDLSDFSTATDARITTKINGLLNGADAAHDTFKELQDLMASDETTAAALATTVGGKVSQSTTVNGHSLSGNVTISKSDIGLGNSDNTSDVNKPISTATQTALNAKQNTLTAQAHIANASGAASTTQVTTYNTLSGLLGISAGLNDANAAQNDLATKYNDLAGKFNTLLAHLQTLEIQASS